METKYFSLSLLLSPTGGGEREEGKRASLAVPPLLALAWNYNRERRRYGAPLEISGVYSHLPPSSVK